jgi:hypothetical protein
MQDIVARGNELQILDSLFESKRAEFLAIWGRRRVGKTYLVRTFFSSKECILFQVTGLKNGKLKQQLDIFANSLRSTFFKSIATPQTWMEAFAFLTEAINSVNLKKVPVVVFLDELPWMASAKSGLLEALDHYWNDKWSSLKFFKLIICGSAASWMLKNIVNNTGGLHNRLTRRIKMLPFCLGEVKQYLKYKNINLNDTQILELYMAIGGIPYYLDELKPGLSAAQNIDALCFKQDGMLFSEYDALFKSLFNKSEYHNQIAKTLMQNKSGMNRKEIAAKCKFALGGRLSIRLSELEAAGFIQQFVPYGHKIKDVHYKLVDEYVMFYLQWILPNRRSLVGKSVMWKQFYATPKYNAWAGYAFEAVCYKHIDQIYAAMGLSNIGAMASSWRYIPKKGADNEGAQIDLLFERQDKVITLCEIKYYDDTYTLDKNSIAALKRKQRVFVTTTKTKKQIFWCLITQHELKVNLHSINISYNVTSKDLFRICQK